MENVVEPMQDNIEGEFDTDAILQALDMAGTSDTDAVEPGEP